MFWRGPRRAGDTERGRGGGKPREKRESFETGADHGGGGGVHQRHVDPLRAVLRADDFSQALWAGLAQELA